VLVVGLTGSIGMGKSTVAARLRALAIPVFDADAEVHRLYAGDAVPLIEAAFPGTAADGKVPRVALALGLVDQVHKIRWSLVDRRLIDAFGRARPGNQRFIVAGQRED
jgi:dephospho-CoA kinase